MTQPSREELLANERYLFESADIAYFKAGRTSEPQDWLEAGLLARQHRNALTALNSVAQAPWQSGDSFPPVECGHMKEFIVAVHRQHSGKVYTFGCSYLNAHRVQYEFCAKDETKEGFCDGCEDGCPTTGWFILTGDGDNESGCYQTLSLKDGDKIMGWQELPHWTSPVSSTNSNGAEKTDGGQSGN